jgi:hypothetical protein
MQEIVCRVGSFWGSYTMWTWALGAGTAAAMVLTLPFVASSAQAPLDQIVGTWRLVSVYEEDDQGQDLDRWGSAPEGEFTASADGRFSLMIVGRHVTRIAGNNAERACSSLKACREFMDQKVVGYAGQVSAGPDNVVFLNITDELEWGWKNRRVITSVKIENERMHFTSSLDPSPTGSFYVHLVWRRKPKQ